MPIYEYHCQQCGIFEVTQRITEIPLTICPTCESDIRRLISATSFVLKGSGWYATDYARSSSKSESSPSDSTSKEGAANGSSDKSGAAPSESSKTTAVESSKSNSDKSASAKPAA
jgi:putative FmdB family regulatory protein